MIILWRSVVQFCSAPPVHFPIALDRALDQPRSTQRYEPLPAEDEQILTADIVELASRYGRYGYRRITALLRHRGWRVNHKRVERLPPVTMAVLPSMATTSPWVS